MGCLQMGFVTEFLDFIDFSVKDGFETFAGDRENDVDVLEFKFAFRHVDLIFPFDGFVFELFDFFFRLEVSDHFTKVPEERPGVVVRVTFFVGDLTLLIFVLFVLFGLLGFGFFLKVSDVESFEDGGEKSFDLANEGCDGFGFGVKEKDTSKVF